jgi:Flp pilus assembly protein TadD
MNEYESDEELWFEAPPCSEPEVAAAPPSSLAPTTEELPAARRLTADERAAAARFQARRARLQRHAVAVLGAAVALLMLGLVVQAHKESQRRLADTLPAARVVQPASSAPHSADAQPTPPVVLAPPASATALAAIDVTGLLRKTRKLLGSGHSREGVQAAREALVADPQNAEPYLLLGAGLQDLGKFAEARQAFRDCLSVAQRGDLASCRYFGR